MIKPLDIVLLSSGGLIPRLIKRFTKFEYNHAGIVIEHLGKLYICEAQERGFNPTHELEAWKKLKDERGDSYIFLRPKEPFDKALGYDRLDSLIGAGYEFLNLTFYQLVRIFTGKYIGPKSDKRVICSEAVAHVYKDYFDKPYLVTPKEIYDNENFELCS